MNESDLPANWRVSSHDVSGAFSYQDVWAANKKGAIRRAKEFQWATGGPKRMGYTAWPIKKETDHE